ncbi:MAG: YceI family protein [Parvularculaceae bacterium]
MMNRMKTALAVTIALAGGPAFAAGVRWSVDADASYIEFSGVQTGNAFTGRFGEFDAEITLDPDDLSDASIVATIKTGTAKTGDRQRDKALPTGTWFASKEHPEARFESSEVVKTGDGAFEAKGTLTIREASEPVTLPFTLAIDGDAATADGSVQLDRGDFAIGQGEFAGGKWVSNDVGVKIHIEATRAAAE